jgi:hypothetical protein
VAPPAENPVTIATIIVNYNAGDTLVRCVDAVLKSTQHSKVYVVDNASTDGSAQALRNMYGDRQGVEFLFNPRNIGFASAVNALSRRLDTDRLLVLNPDCILEQTALERLGAALDNDPRAALAGPAVVDGRGRIQRATVRRFPDPWKSLMTATGLARLGRICKGLRGVEVKVPKDRLEPFIVDAVSGACMLIRREAFTRVGYLDEGYAMHCEDLDLMYRLQQDGWHCLYVPGAVCTHLQGLSSRSRPGWVHLQKHRGMLRFFNKFQARGTAWPMRLLVRAGIWLRYALLWPLVMMRR